MTQRDRLVVVIAACVALVIGAWMVVVQPKRSDAAKLGDKVKSAQTQLDAARTQVAEGQAAKNLFSSNYTSLAKLGKAVPVDDDVPSLIYQLQNAASAAGVDFSVLQLQPGSSSSTPAPTTSGSATQAASATLPPGASIGPAGFPTLPFTFSFQGNFFRLARFFNLLQKFVVTTGSRISVNGRLMTLDGITLGPGPQGFPQVKATIAATTFILPAAQGLLNGATSSGPSAAAAGPAGTTSNGSVPGPSTAAVSAR